MDALQYMTDEQIKTRLVEEYTRADDGETILLLRDELYNRGYEWADIVELAIAALMRRMQVGGTYSLN